MAFDDEATVKRARIQTNRALCRIATRTMPAWPRNSDVMNSQARQSRHGIAPAITVSHHLLGVVHQLHVDIAQPCGPCCMTLSSADSPVRKRVNLGHLSRHQGKFGLLTLHSVRCWCRLGCAQVSGALVLPLADRREYTLRDALQPFYVVPSLEQPCVPLAAALCGGYGVLRAETI